jgi:ABC-type Zn uptake system ZnuABC Zn-binding protein ZnuA
MKAGKVPVLLCANFTPPKIPQQVAQKTGAKLLLLPPSVGGESGIETYIDLFEHLITELERAFEDRKEGGP